MWPWANSLTSLSLSFHLVQWGRAHLHLVRIEGENVCQCPELRSVVPADSHFPPGGLLSAYIPRSALQTQWECNTYWMMYRGRGSDSMLQPHLGEWPASALLSDPLFGPGLQYGSMDEYCVVGRGCGVRQNPHLCPTHMHMATLQWVHDTFLSFGHTLQNEDSDGGKPDAKWKTRNLRSLSSLLFF